MSDASRIPIKPLGIGEVALRVNDLRRSTAFYCETLGFTLVRVLHDSIAFIRVADGVEGHTQVIGLFSRDRQASGDGQTWDGWNPRLSTLHHFAIEISLKEYENVLQYLRAQKLDPSTAVHDWSSIAFRSQRAPLTNGWIILLPALKGSGIANGRSWRNSTVPRTAKCPKCNCRDFGVPRWRPST